MAITRLNPNTILLAPTRDRVIIEEEGVAGESITPGFLVEHYDASGTLKWRAHATDSEQVSTAVALERDIWNTGIATAYAAGEVPVVANLYPGCVFYGIIPSGQDISAGELLQSNGDGKLKTASATTASANVAKFQSLDAPGAVTADTRLRVKVIQ